MRRRLGVGLLIAVLAAVLPAAALGFNPLTEAQNYAKIQERLTYLTLTPDFQAKLQAQNTRATPELAGILANDPERNPLGNVCANHTNECAGDVRFYDWNGVYGRVDPVVFTARDGATISGHIWSTRAGPAKRPGIVITTGSVQAPETLYWGLAAVLAKHGYVVMTYDVQGQGQSDTFGEGADQQEGVPSQSGQPFYDGTEDALDFLFSTPRDPYKPRKSCSSGTSHAAKQSRRVAAGLNSAYNPRAAILDTSRVGIAGHSLGAAGVSYVGQEDPRVKAIVAWDNLSASRAPGGPSTVASGGQSCASNPASRAPVAVTKPALGMSADYYLTPTPYSSDPDPQSKNGAFLAYQAAGVDSGSIIIRGGTHYEFSFIPGNTVPEPLGTATYRGEDMVAWYTTAWFDKYVKGGDSTADARLLTNRWCDDRREKAVDSSLPPDGNMYSFYLASRLDISRSGGGRAVSDNMRNDCANPASVLKPDGLAPDYDFVADAHTPDIPGKGGSGPSGSAVPCRGVNRTSGSRRRDRIRGTPGRDNVYSRGGRDRIAVRAGNDCVRAGRGRDRARGQKGADALFGQAGGDRLSGGAGRDVLSGGRGNDHLSGGKGNDLLDGGPGNDVLKARDGKVDVVDCGAGKHDRAVVDASDQLNGCERVSGR